MTPYKHTVQYYETDKMGITHHSNYIRWMEEARVDFLNQIGWSYQKMEEEGIASAVTAVDGRYRAATGFSDEVEITVAVRSVKGAVPRLGYTMKNRSGRTVFEGSSEHCFINRDNRLVRLRNAYPALYELLGSLVAEDDTEKG